jgi:hypothetical protein
MLMLALGIGRRAVVRSLVKFLNVAMRRGKGTVYTYKKGLERLIVLFLRHIYITLIIRLLLNKL